MTQKINKLACGLAFSALLLTACEPSTEEKIDQDLTRLGNYMDSVKTVSADYSEAKWEEVKAKYNSTIDEIDVQKTKLSESAGKKLETVKAEYNKLKADFEKKIADKKADDYKIKLRKGLFADNEIGDDRNFSFVNSKNALAVYDRFVTTVKKNQNEYSREDWDEIKLLYEALDSRKNEIEKELPSADNLKIAKLKVEFAAIKTVKRPLAKADENAEAKQ